jgi:DNA polymerase-3 subunit delta
MILSKRPDVDRFLKAPPSDIRAALIWGRDRGGVHERADALAGVVAERPDDPFNVAILTEADLDKDGARLEDELSALSMIGGRRLVRLRMTEGRAGAERAAAEALKRHAEGAFNADAFFLVEAGALERGSALRKAAEAAKGAASIPVYEDEVGDLARMVREALARDRVALSSEALDLFVARLPKERGVARQEIERLILYLGPGSGVTATPADLEAYLGVEPEASLQEAAADAFGGRAQ